MPLRLWQCVVACLAVVLVSSVSGSSEEKPLWCFYNPRSVDRPWYYQPQYIPVEYCSVVVYAYVGISRDGRNLSSLQPEIDYDMELLQTVPKLKAKRQTLNVYLAVGGSSMNSELFAIPAEDFHARADLFDNVLKWLQYFDYDGVVLHIARPEAFTTTDDSNDLVLAMGAFLRRHSMGYSVVLPPEENRRKRFFSPCDYATKLDYVIQWSHDLVQRPQVPTCPAPLHSDEGQLSVAGILQSILSSYDVDGCYVLLDNLLFTFSYAGFKFNIHKATGRHRNLRPIRRLAAVDLNSVMTVAYHEICTKVTRRRWNSSYNPETGCTDTGDLDTWVSYPGRPPRQILSQIGGAVAFDMEMDDFMGMCGKRSSLTRTLFNLLNT